MCLAVAVLWFASDPFSPVPARAWIAQTRSPECLVLPGHRQPQRESSQTPVTGREGNQLLKPRNCLTSARIVLHQELIQGHPSSTNADHDRAPQDADQPQLLGIAELRSQETELRQGHESGSTTPSHCGLHQGNAWTTPATKLLEILWSQMLLLVYRILLWFPQIGSYGSNTLLAPIYRSFSAAWY